MDTPTFTDFTDPEQAAAAVAAQVEDLPAYHQVAVLLDQATQAAQAAMFDRPELDLIAWMMETATENNPDDEDLTALAAKVRRLMAALQPEETT